MIVNGRTLTFGEFFDAVYETKSTEARARMEDWKNHGTTDGWKADRALPLTDEIVYHFVEEMCEMVSQDHGTFSHELLLKARDFGVNVSNIVNTRITP